MAVHQDDELDFGDDDLAPLAHARPPVPAPAPAPAPQATATAHTATAKPTAPAAAPAPKPGGHDESLDENGRKLPDGWVSRVSKSTQRIYYRNTRLNTSEWDIPTAPAPGPVPSEPPKTAAAQAHAAPPVPPKQDSAPAQAATSTTAKHEDRSTASKSADTAATAPAPRERNHEGDRKPEQARERPRDDEKPSRKLPSLDCRIQRRHRLRRDAGPHRSRRSLHGFPPGLDGSHGRALGP